jgi:hypothetical protein
VTYLLAVARPASARNPMQLADAQAWPPSSVLISFPQLLKHTSFKHEGQTAPAPVWSPPQAQTSSNESTGQSSASAAWADGWPHSTTTKRSFCSQRGMQHTSQCSQHSPSERTASLKRTCRMTGLLTGALSAASLPPPAPLPWAPTPFPLLPLSLLWLPLLLLSPVLVRCGSSFSSDLLSCTMSAGRRHETQLPVCSSGCQVRKLQ